MSPMVSEHDVASRRRDGPDASWTRRDLLRIGAAAVTGAAALTVAQCAAPPSPETTPTLAGLADRYVQLARQLARHQPSLVEAWLGGGAEATRRPVPPLRAEAARLTLDADAALAAARQAATSSGGADERQADVVRAAYLAGQARALDEAAARLLGEGHAFAAEATRALGHAVPPRDAAALDALRRDLATLLPGPGTLAERHAAFRRRAAVPPARVEAVFQAAIAWCRTATRPYLALPDGETLTAHVAETDGWAGTSRPTAPLASDLAISNRGVDAAHLLQLAAHEGVPGHHAQHVLASAWLVQRRGWTERLLHPSFGPHRLVAEGAAEAGADLLLPVDTRIRVCAEVLLPAAGLPSSLAPMLARVERLAAQLDLEVAYVAAEYLDTALGVDAATTRLRDDALVLDPAGMVGFIERQRTRMLAYPVGRRLVRDALDAAPEDRRWGRLAAIAATCSLEPWSAGAIGNNDPA